MTKTIIKGIKRKQLHCLNAGVVHPWFFCSKTRHAVDFPISPRSLIKPSLESVCTWVVVKDCLAVSVRDGGRQAVDRTHQHGSLARYKGVMVAADVAADCTLSLHHQQPSIGGPQMGKPCPVFRPPVNVVLMTRGEVRRKTPLHRPPSTSLPVLLRCTRQTFA